MQILIVADPVYRRVILFNEILFFFSRFNLIGTRVRPENYNGLYIGFVSRC